MPHAAQTKPLLVLSRPCCSLELSVYFDVSACHSWNRAVKKDYGHICSAGGAAPLQLSLHKGN